MNVEFNLSENLLFYKENIEDFLRSRIKNEFYQENYIVFYVVGFSIIFVSILLFLNGLKFTQWYIFGHKSLFPIGFYCRSNTRNPAYYGLDAAQNIYVGGQEGKIGAWYVKTTVKEVASILLLHDVGMNRSHYSNISVIKKLTSFGCNVLVIDYRGFGDSDGSPTCEGLVDDSVRCFKWLAEFEKAKHIPLIIYGKRLGASIGIETVSLLNKEEIPISSLIIDSGFDALKNYVKNKPSYNCLIVLPFMHRFIEDIDKSFDSTRSITKVKCDVLFLHSSGDKEVPSFYAHKLFEQYIEVNKIYKAKFIMFEKNYNHQTLLQSPQYEINIMDVIKKSRPIFPGFHFFDSIRTGAYKAVRFEIYLIDELFIIIAQNWDIPLSAISANWIKFIQDLFTGDEEIGLFLNKIKEYTYDIDWLEVGSICGNAVGKVAKMLLNPENILNPNSLNSITTTVENLKENINAFLE